MKRVLLLAVLALFTTPLIAQNLKIGIVDMERAIVQSVDGKKSEATFTTKFEEYRKSIETRQKDLDTAQTKLRTQERLLGDGPKAELTRDITRRQTDLTRLQEDAQKELDTLRADLMRPIATVAEGVLNKYSADNNFTLIIDTSNPNNTSILWFNPKAEVTDAIIKLIDAELAKAPAAPAAPKKP